MKGLGMAQLTNIPLQRVLFRVAARKSFSFAVHVLEPGAERPVDLTDCTLEIVMKSPRAGTDTPADDENLITNSTGVIEDAEQGFARFDLQSTDLNVPDGEYPFVVVLTTAAGYSIPAILGDFDITFNPEYGSLSTSYTGEDSSGIIDVILREQQVIKVAVGAPVPPGYSYMSDADREMLNGIAEIVGVGFGTAAFKDIEYFASAAAGMPPAGAKFAIPVKASDESYHVQWAAPESALPPSGIYGHVEDLGTYTRLIFTSAPPISAAGITEGFVPTANGDGTWGWALGGTGTGGTTDADEIIDGDEKVMMTVEERAKLEALEPQVNADWAASTGVSRILNKPTLVSPTHTHRFLDLDGVSRGTAAPTGGEDGDVYIRIP